MNILILPRDRPGDATYAGIAAQIESGTIQVIQARRVGRERRQEKSFREHEQRAEQRRRIYAWPIPSVKMVFNP